MSSVRGWLLRFMIHLPVPDCSPNPRFSVCHYGSVRTAVKETSMEGDLPAPKLLLRNV